jgi:hypothetical protein
MSSVRSGGQWKTAEMVMQDLILHPITFQFQVPIVREKTPESDGYFAVIQNPQDLTTILKRIQNGGYNTVKDWLNDLEIVWYNSDKYYHDETHFIVSEECRRIFENLLRKSGLYPMENWCQDLYEMRDRLMRKVETTPMKYKNLMIPIGPEAERRNGRPEAKVQALAKALEILGGEVQIGLAVILARNKEPKETAPDGTQGWLIDLNTVNHKTFQDLEEFAALRLKKKGIRYPGNEDEDEDSSE